MDIKKLCEMLLDGVYNETLYFSSHWSCVSVHALIHLCKGALHYTIKEFKSYIYKEMENKKSAYLHNWR